MTNTWTSKVKSAKVQFCADVLTRRYADEYPQNLGELEGPELRTKATASAHQRKEVAHELANTVKSLVLDEGKANHGAKYINKFARAAETGSEVASPGRGSKSSRSAPSRACDGARSQCDGSVRGL